MDLNGNVWYVRLFFWSLGIYQAFRDDDYRFSRSYVESRGTNLCFFVRVMVVYMPLILLLHLVVVVLAVASLTVWPIYLFGGIAYGGIWAIIALVIGIIWAVKFARNHARPSRQQRFAREGAAEGEQVMAEAFEGVASIPKGPGFFEVIWTYLVSVKKKFCPSITFMKETSQ